MLDLRTAAPFARRFRDTVLVVKIGGACLERPRNAQRLARDLAVIQALGAQLVVVHGAGPQVDQRQRALGEEPRKVGGRRVTSPKALLALCQTTLGELNPQLASRLTAAGAPAVGLCGAGANVLLATRRPAVVTEEGEIDFGSVGDLGRSDPDPLLALLKGGFIPVLSPPAGDGRGGMLNVNADLAAAHVAVALGARKLILVTSAAGILTDPDDPASLVSTLSLAELMQLHGHGALRDGMAVKAEAIRLALEGGVQRVHVVSGNSADGLLGELYTTHGTGTLVTLSPVHEPPAPPGESPVAGAAHAQGGGSER